MKNDAFISYSHAQDSQLAASLEKALEKFAKPLLRRRALSICRDENHLSASPDLWASIEANLAASEYFILMASPASAESKWCRKEVEYWMAHKPMDKFLIALTGGTLHWDEAAGDFDWAATNAIPDQLAGAFKNEPLFVDCREPIPPEEQTASYPDFERIVVQFAATLHGKKVGDMIGEAARQHRKNRMLRNGAIGVLSVLTLVASGLFVYANQQRNAAEKSRDQAETLLKLTLQGRGERYQPDADIDTVIGQLNWENTRPIAELIEVKAFRERVTRGNFDYMVWLDVPSFRTDDIREVRYEWPEDGFRYARESFVTREPSTGYAFAWRGTARIKDEIRIDIILADGESIEITFPVREHLEVSYNEVIEPK